ncbi:MAG TPA: TolC family protein [Methylomirabilota bacterium]|nr:TolC family protein [Methylomirabilota bacterium]
MTTVAIMFALVALGAPAAARGQPPGFEVTVDELVARAVADNPDLKAARADLEAARGRVRQAALRPNPMVELGGQKALGPDNNLMVGLTVPLDLNGRRKGRVGVAEREEEVRRALLAERERRLRADVRLRAGELLAARRNLEVADDLLAINREALALVSRRVTEGAATPLEENLTLVEVGRLEASRELLGSRLEVATLGLKALVARRPEDPLTLRGDLTAAPAVPARDGAIRQALAERPDLRAAGAEVAAAQARIRKEEAEGRWDASVNVGYQRQDFGFGLRGLTDSGATRPIQDVFHYFGGGISIMLPVRNQNQGNVAAARAETTAAERRREFMELMARQEVDAAYAQHAAAQRSLELYGRGVRDVARRNLDVVRQAYRLGRGTLLDVIAEQRRYIEIENGYTDVLKQVYDAAVEIERAVVATSR